MSVVAVYNMKGGVGKTTTAVNLSYLAAATGQRVLLWDLDPQAASSFAYRVRPHVDGFSKNWMEGGEVLAAAIRETDYENLDVLPADFTYRKFDRLLLRFAKPERVVTSLLETFRRDYDVVVLDCPAGFSLLIEGMFAAADAIVVPTIPTVLSLRMVVQLIEWTIRSDSSSELAAFFSMVDRRKVLHRRICEWSSGLSEVFLHGQVPYVSVVEQMAVRRMPLAVFAPRDVATGAFEAIWAELQTRLQERSNQSHRPRDRWGLSLQTLESLIVRLESVNGEAAKNNPGPGPAPSRNLPEGDEAHFVHSFDTDSRDLCQSGYVLELREREGELLLVAGVSGDDRKREAARGAAARIDSSWASEILAGAMSPLDALEQRLRRPAPSILGNIRDAVYGRTLHRINSRAAGHALVENDSLTLRHA